MTENGSSLEFNDLCFTRFYLLLQFFDATKGLSNGIVYNRMNSLLLLPLNFFHFLKWSQLRNYLLLIFLIVRKSILEFLIIWSIYRISSFANTFQSQDRNFYTNQTSVWMFVNKYSRVNILLIFLKERFLSYHHGKISN